MVPGIILILVVLGFAILQHVSFANRIAALENDEDGGRVSDAEEDVRRLKNRVLDIEEFQRRHSRFTRFDSQDESRPPSGAGRRDPGPLD